MDVHFVVVVILEYWYFRQVYNTFINAKTCVFITKLFMSKGGTRRSFCSEVNYDCFSWQTEVIPNKDEIDPDVLNSMSSLGCFKNREKLIRNLLKQE